MPLLRIGLTGNVAAGKSTVARVWRSLGAPLVEADRLAREAVAPGTAAHARIAGEWGDEVLSSDGTVDRARLRRIVFSDPEARARLEAIVHPAVAALLDREYRRLEAAGKEVVVADIPLLFEVGMEDELDRIVLVDAPLPVRRDRLIRTRGLSPAEADRMISSQMPSECKRDRSDLVIENHGTLEELEERAVGAWRELVEGRRA